MRAPRLYRTRKAYDQMAVKLDLSKAITYLDAAGRCQLTVRWSDNLNPGTVPGTDICNFTETAEYATAIGAFQNYRITYLKMKLQLYQIYEPPNFVSYHDILVASETKGDQQWNDKTSQWMRGKTDYQSYPAVTQK